MVGKAIPEISSVFNLVFFCFGENVPTGLGHLRIPTLKSLIKINIKSNNPKTTKSNFSLRRDRTN